MVCYDGLVAYSMCGNLDRHRYVEEQTIKMCLVVGGVARNNTPDSHWRAEITRADALIKDFSPSPITRTNLCVGKLPISYYRGRLYVRII